MANELTKCPLCKSQRIIKVGKPKMSSQAAALVHAKYQIVKCKNCEIYFVSPKIALSKKEWEILYGSQYFSGKTSWWKKKRQRDRIRRLNWLQEYCDHKITKFLDIGCGEGLTLLEADKRGWSAYGIDISDNRTDCTKKVGINFRKSDICESSFPDNYFDSIYMDSVLEHLIDPCHHLREVNRVLRKDGVLYIGVPNERSLFNTVKKFLLLLIGMWEMSAHLYPFKRPFHVIGFTKKSLFLILNKCGFDIMRYRNFAGEYEWLKHKLFSKLFIIEFLLLPFHLAAIPFKKQIYMEVIVRKK